MAVMAFPAFLLVITDHADAQETPRVPPRPATQEKPRVFHWRDDSCEVRARDERGRRARFSGCLKCRPGYLMKGGGCVRVGDFGSGPGEPRPERGPKPIQPIR